MPRVPRNADFGTIHHVMNRGARRAPVFDDDATCLRFLDLLGDCPKRFGIKIHAYALMPNHFHLMLSAGGTGLAPALQYLQGQYSRWLNGTRHWDGPVWTNRFRSRQVEDEPYLAHLLAYLHLNPVAAHLAPDVDTAEWTSHPFYAGTSRAPEWLTTSELLSVFGSTDAYQEYVADVHRGRETGPPDFDPSNLWTTPTRTLPTAGLVRPAPRATARPLTDEAAWAALEVVTGHDRATLCRRDPGPEPSPLWWLTLWWLPRATHRRPIAWARELRIHPAALSRAAQQVATAVRSDAALADQWARLLTLLPDPS